MKKIILSLLLCSCTNSVEPETPVVEPEQNTETINPVKLLPTSVMQESMLNESFRKCVVKTTKVNNCILTQVWCTDEDGGYQLVDQDVSCFNPRKLFPWEYIPDPPPYRPHNKGAK